jgi:hypothetical protein
MLLLQLPNFSGPDLLKECVWAEADFASHCSYKLARLYGRGDVPGAQSWLGRQFLSVGSGRSRGSR